MTPRELEIRILGCSGGIGDTRKTTSFLIGNNILMDAGTGVGDLKLEELCKIDHVFLTHSHLDHICSLPLLLDSVIDYRENPVNLYAIPETLKALKEHIFNWKIWPDFTKIPQENTPLLRLNEIKEGVPTKFEALEINAIPANHTVPAIGYEIKTGRGSIVFTGDTTDHSELWQILNKISDLKCLIIESAFSNAEHELAKLSKHFYASQLIDALASLRSKPRVLVTHLKPGKEKEISRELLLCPKTIKIELLADIKTLTI